MQQQKQRQLSSSKLSLSTFFMSMTIGYCFLSCFFFSLHLQHNNHNKNDRTNIEVVSAEDTATKLSSSFHGNSDHSNNSSRQCLQWPPPTAAATPAQVLIVGFHPDKTGGSTIARFLEAQEKENGGDFEMMETKNCLWLLRWLGDENFRKQHPKVFVHFHNKHGFSRDHVVKRAKEELSDEMFRVVQPDAVQPRKVKHFSEYIMRLLAMHERRLSQSGHVKLLCLPHWREPGDHFVSAAMFLDKALEPELHENKQPKLGPLGHAQRVKELLSNYSWPQEWQSREIDKRVEELSPGGKSVSLLILQYYTPDIQLRYYFSKNSPISIPLHHHYSMMNQSNVENRVVEQDDHKTFSFDQAMSYVNDFLHETQNITLWAITDRMDQSMLLTSLAAGFTNIYEPGTCLPIWDVLGTNTNTKRKRDREEMSAANFARRWIAPGSMVLHPLFVQAHADWWNRDIHLLEPHLNAVVQARNKFRNDPMGGGGVEQSILARRKSYKTFLQQK